MQADEAFLRRLEERQRRFDEVREKLALLSPGALKLPQTGPLVTPVPPGTPEISAETIRAVQSEMSRLGCYSGPLNGRMSEATKRAADRARGELAKTKPVGPSLEELLPSLKERQRGLCVTAGTRGAEPPKPAPKPAAAPPAERPRQAARPPREEPPEPRRAAPRPERPRQAARPEPVRRPSPPPASGPRPLRSIDF